MANNSATRVSNSKRVKVVSLTFVASSPSSPLKETVKANLSPAKAQGLADKLNEQAIEGSFDPREDKIVTYAVEAV
jgi:hypothetical protein